MWPFSSSSSSTSTTTQTPTVAAGAPGSLPDRSTRQQCWDSRDAYFGCLEKSDIVVPGSESSSVCKSEKEGYEMRCAKSWVDYFNKRRVLQLRQDKMNAQAAQQRLENGAAPSAPRT